jgi:hypothetical protein
MSDTHEEDPQVYLTDRTTAETDDKCGMRRWWYKHEGGIGIVPKEESIHLLVGRDTHIDLAHAAEMEDISPAAVQAYVDKILNDGLSNPDITLSQKEALYRRVGWFAAYTLFVEPKIRADYENVSTEAEHILDRTPLWVTYTPDRYLRHRQGRYLVYREYKSTKWANNGWLNSWTYAPQIHIGLAGMQEELGEKVAFAQVMGLMKGEVRDGKLGHPYVWAWQNSATGEWTHDYNKARAAVWERYPVWEFPQGPVEWVQLCGPEVASAQFPHTAPIFLNERLLNDWTWRRTFREMQVSEVLEESRHDWQKRIVYFEPRTAQCRPVVGDPCPYLLACNNAAVRENPLACSDFVRRTPHHETEVRLLADGVISQ